MRLLQSLRGRTPNARELLVQGFDRTWAAVARPPDLITSGAGPGRKLAFSFDDGPSAANTAAVLDLLDEHDAKGTFFLVGSRISGHEDVLQRAAAGAHELANHTYSHVHTVHLSREALRYEVEQTNTTISTALGGVEGSIRLVRPPFGKDRRRINSVARELGLVTALWSIDSGDARYFTIDEVVATVLQHAAPGAIVLMHDGGLRRDTTLSALAALLPELRERGFELVTISELLEAPAS
jgi:peptidoglycan/xylan/chitin deacetylase (PgdA/CDA1 family)